MAKDSRTMIIVVGFVTIVGGVGPVLGDVGKAAAAALGMAVFLVVGIVLAIRERKGRVPESFLAARATADVPAGPRTGDDG